MKNRCNYCGTEQTIKKSDLKVWKASKDEIKDFEKKKEEVNFAYEEYKKLSRNNNFFKKIYYFFFDWDSGFYLGKDFDMWLFTKRKDIWIKTIDIKYFILEIKCWKCKLCGSINRI